MHTIYKRLVMTTLIAASMAGAWAQQGSADYQKQGLTAPRNSLPVFFEALRAKMPFAYGWTDATTDFTAWRTRGLEKARELMIWDPSQAPFDMVVLEEEKRGSYTAKKVVFNISAESRVMAYLLVPKGKGPFPAAVMLHDHGGMFYIGKEKMVMPFGDANKLKAAQDWAKRYFSGRFPGDELAKRGYVVLSFDALAWGDRSVEGYGGESQQALAANLFNLGSSYGALIAQEDARAAEFLASLKEVDKTRVCAVGFSMGAFRAWQVAALSDAVTACIADCWMATMRGLMVEGNNQLKGQSAFTMMHPGQARWLDYPDVAGLAAPKPLLIYAGEKDGLFPIASVREASDKIAKIYAAAGAAERYSFQVWPTDHNFDADRQDAAYAWLDGIFKPKK